MKTIYILASLMTANFVSFGQSEDPEFRQKVQRYEESAKKDTLHSNDYFQLGVIFTSRNIDSAMFYFRESGRRYAKLNENYNNNGWQALMDLSGKIYNSEYFIEAYEAYYKNEEAGYERLEKYKLLKGLRDNPTADGYVQLGDELTKPFNSYNENWKTFMIRYDNGIKSYDQAVKLDPAKKAIVQSKITGGMKGIADAYFNDGNYEDALKKYEQTVKYTQKDPELYSAIGFIKLEKLTIPDYKGALANFQKALVLTTASMKKKDCLENIGLCYEKMKDYPNAIIYYDKSITQEPNFARSAHFKLARVYDATGNKEKAKYHRMKS